MTLSHGRGARGGAAHVSGVLVTVGCIFTLNTAMISGSAVYAANPAGHFQGHDTLFTLNRALGEDGDLHADRGGQARVSCHGCKFEKRRSSDANPDLHLVSPVTGQKERQHSALSRTTHPGGGDEL